MTAIEFTALDLYLRLRESNVWQSDEGVANLAEALFDAGHLEHYQLPALCCDEPGCPFHEH